MNQSELKEILNYDPSTGVFTWAKTISSKAQKGCRAGRKLPNSSGYYEICIARTLYGVHRLAFLYMQGHFPRCVDHIDGNKCNNRIENLREATASENQMNRGVRAGSTTGERGIGQRRGKFRARIAKDGKSVHLGDFLTLEEAVNARVAAENELFGDFAR